MKSEVHYNAFIGALRKKHPNKTQLVNSLVDLLCIDRESVYRRLKGDIKFTAHEILQVASAWNISLDEITGVNPGQVSFQLQQVNYFNPSEDEMNLLRQIIKSINYSGKFPDMKIIYICNKLPHQLLSGYEYLNRFYLLSQFYQYDSENKVVPFSQIIISEEKRQLTKNYYNAIKQVPNTDFILDRRLFDDLIHDIRYYYSIRLINTEEKELIKKDLYALLDYLSKIADKGYYPETKNKVDIYISQLNVNTNYNYIITPEANICFINVFEKYEIYTLNPEMVEKFKTWMQLKVKTATQISKVDEKTRMEFFVKQQEFVDSL